MTVGVSTPRIDGIEKVTGEAKFTGDLMMPGLLEAKVLRSPLPHALIESIDTSKAESLAGVVAILTRDDLKDIDPYYGNCLRDRAVVVRLLLTDAVRSPADPLVAPQPAPAPDEITAALATPPTQLHGVIRSRRRARGGSRFAASPMLTRTQQPPARYK